ncbi:MAG: LysM peptidoglycan-binding domain-containing protein [Bacteroidales bacterium]
MKKVRTTILIFVLFVSVFPYNLYSQQDSIVVKRSDDKVKISGELYYIHIVEKGQTLYSISRAYDVSQRAIAKENPDILLGIKTGQALKIPYHPSEDERFQPTDTANYIYHTVRPGETLYSLSREYNVSTDDIKAENPVLHEEGLKADQIVKIPKEPKIETTKDEPRDTIDKYEEDQRKGDYIYHKIKKDETLYSISKKYDVEIDDIKKANKDIRQDDLKLGSVLQIPVKSETDEMSELFIDILNIPESGFDTTSLTYYDIQSVVSECNEDSYYKRRGINVDLFLPLYTEKNFEKTYIDSSEVDDDGETIEKEKKREPDYIFSDAKNFIEFYEGIILSLDSLANKDIKINLRVFDTKNNTNRVRKILEEEEFRNTDLIIGPIYKENVKLVSEFAKEEQIDIVSPFVRNSSWLKDHENLVQVYPSQEAQMERFASHIAQFSDNNMVFVHTGDSLYYPEIKEFKNTVFSYISMDTSLVDVRFKEVAFRDSLFYLEQALNHEEENIVVVPTNNEAFVTDVITNLHTLYKKDYPIKVFGFSDWKDFENLDQEYLYNLKLNLFTPFYVNYEDKEVKDVVRKYRKLFESEPSKYVFHGFDIGFYFFNAMYNFGRDYQNCMLSYTPELCHSDYQFFRRSDKYGVENIAITVLQYNEDFSIEELKLDPPIKQEPEKHDDITPARLPY